MDTESYLYNPQQMINAELSPNEKLLWTGQPPLGVRLRATDAKLIPISILWGGFAFVWEIVVIKTHSPISFRLFGIPFVGMGLYFIIGRFFADAYVRQRTFYGVTSSRIIILSKGWQRKTVSLDLSSLNNLTIIEQASGAGVIEFELQSQVSRQERNSRFWSDLAGYASTRFELAENARAVYDIIRGAQDRKRQA